MKQEFKTNRIAHTDDAVEGLSVAFGNLLPDRSPVHSLYICRGEEHQGPGAACLEFNDQINACLGRAIKDVELADGHLRILFAE